MKMEKKILLCSMCIVILLGCVSCGQKGSAQLEGSLTDIMAGLYEKADLSEDFRAGMDSFETFELTEDLDASILGTTEIDYVEGVASIPMISPNAYQCVLLRVAEDSVDTVKQQLKDNADLNKWVCVSAETMLIESRGDVIFFIMGDNDTAYAMNDAFLKY